MNDEDSSLMSFSLFIPVVSTGSNFPTSRVLPTVKDLLTGVLSFVAGSPVLFDFLIGTLVLIGPNAYVIVFLREFKKSSSSSSDSIFKQPSSSLQLILSMRVLKLQSSVKTLMPFFILQAYFLWKPQEQPHFKAKRIFRVLKVEALILWPSRNLQRLLIYLI